MRKNSLIPDIRYLEAKVRKLTAENALLKERLRAGYREPKISPTREKVRKYKESNPEATLREIQKACKISSVSVVDFHLRKIKLEEFDKNRQIALRESNNSVAA